MKMQIVQFFQDMRKTLKGSRRKAKGIMKTGRQNRNLFKKQACLLFLAAFILCLSLGFAVSAHAERPAFDGNAYVTIEGFDFPSDLQQITGNQLFQINCTPLDHLGRPGAVSVVITKESVSGQRRENMSKIVPTGFVQEKYPFIEQEYLYQRCHLIGSQFKVNTEIPENIVTGTHFLNLHGMYSIENQVASYVLSSGNSVYYYVQPDFEGDELVCRGITIAAVSLAAPEELKMAVYCFNVEPGVMIDYSTGYSMLAETSGTVVQPRSMTQAENEIEEQDYILNVKSLKFHYPYCSGVENMKENNRQSFHGSRETLIEMGYSPCKICNP